MRRSILWTSVALVAGLVGASLAEARGGGRGPMGGGRGTPRGGISRTGPGAGRTAGKTDNSEEAMKELEDRVALIAERRKSLADGDREASQEARLSAGRLDTAEARGGEDVR